MAEIDYSEIKYTLKSNENHSVENSFYLQKSKETPDRYTPYHKVDTDGSHKIRIEKE